MGLFYAQGQISRYGSPVPTEFQTARYPLESGPLYVTPFQKDLVSVLLMTCGVAAFGSVALGLLLRQKYGQPLE